ncbi:MAG: hypothetical protein K0R57_3940 [Paenibacillaceae bacterium]|jgi:signal transduction histidine kinase|nr:hypothetical protein [Paenibacillaceae bacterium]
MNMSFKKLILATAVSYAVLAGGLVLVLARYGPGREVWTACLLFILAAGAILAGFMYGLRRRMLHTLAELSVFVQELSNGRIAAQELPQEDMLSAKLPQEDTLPAKLQSQILQFSRRLDRERCRYQEESREIRMLISDISHQLKTPAANLAMYAGLLQDETLPENKRREFTRHMAGQTEKLGWMMNSLIKLSRLESGIIELRSEDGAVVNTVLAAVKQAYPQAEAKGLELALAGDTDIVLPHDPRWTAEAFHNLLDNAVKYSGDGEGGSIVIDMKRYDLFARVDFRDKGMGIAPHEISQVFRRFYRGENARGTEGVGIGLYLARKIIAAQGGYMKVSSKPGEGSCFSVFLPLK